MSKVIEKSPYEVFSDEVVRAQLGIVSPIGYTLMALNQVDSKALFKTSTGFLVVFKYTSHYPDDVSSYYFMGSSHEGMRGVQELFGGTYSVQPNDKMLYDQSFDVIEKDRVRCLSASA